MKIRNLLLTLFAFLTLSALAACSPPPASANRDEVSDLTGLVDALAAAGAEVEASGPVSQEFLGPEGQILKVNGQDVQVFEYPDVTEALSDARSISPDGSSTGTTMITWVDAPHFFQSGKLIVLYVGSDAGTLELLESLLGPQFAGR